MENSTTCIVHLIPLEDSEYALMHSTIFDVQVLRSDAPERQFVNREGLYDLLDELSRDSSVQGLFVNAFTAAATDNGHFALHYCVTRTEQDGVLKWEQTIFEHERLNYFEIILKKPKGRLSVSETCS